MLQPARPAWPSVQRYRGVFARGQSFDAACLPRAHPDYDVEELDDWIGECDEEGEDDLEEEEGDDREEDEGGAGMEEAEGLLGHLGEDSDALHGGGI
jgi:hypothetical protein